MQNKTAMFINRGIHKPTDTKMKNQEVSLSPFLALCHEAGALATVGFPSFHQPPAEERFSSVRCLAGWLSKITSMLPGRDAVPQALIATLKHSRVAYEAFLIPGLRTVFSRRTLSHYQVLFNFLIVTGIVIRGYDCAIS